jgi:hypothetical protein
MNLTPCDRLRKIYVQVLIVLVSGTPARRAKPGQVSLASVGGAVEAFCRAVAPGTGPTSHQRCVPWDYRHPYVW